MVKDASMVGGIGSVRIELRVNGEETSLIVEPRTLLVNALRDELALTGTKIGCDTSQCGACTVLVDGRAFKSCTLLAVRLDGEARLLSVHAQFGPDQPSAVDHLRIFHHARKTASA